MMRWIYDGLSSFCPSFSVANRNFGHLFDIISNIVYGSEREQTDLLVDCEHIIVVFINTVP